MNTNNIQKIIYSLEGDFIEIAGPTPGGYELLEDLRIKIPDKVTITNTSNPVILFPYGDNPETHYVDEVLDVNDLADKYKNLGLIMVSSLPKQLRSTLLHNSYSSLRPGGLLIIQGEIESDREIAKSIGFSALIGAELAEKHYSQIYRK